MEIKEHIVVVGGGFAGLELIKRLNRSKQYDVTLVDVNNYNFFPPILYQVAAGFMEPSSISYPYRRILRSYPNINFRMGKLISVNTEQNTIVLNNGELSYDILVLCTGTKPNFFGNENVEETSMPMKTIEDALALRNSYLSRLERATREGDKEERKKLLSYVIAGAGPTGVELSGIFAEMRKNILERDYPQIKEDDLGEIYLLDGADSVLPPMSEDSQKYTHEKLDELGIKVQLNALVEDYKDDLVELSDGNKIATKNLIWTAGVISKVFEGFKDVDYGDGQRLITNRFNRLIGYSNIYALGDTAIIKGDPEYPDGHPQLAQPAIQQAKNLGRNFNRPKHRWRLFKYRDKGTMAIIGRNKAVADIPKLNMHLNGFIAWVIWVVVHIMSLINFRTKIFALYDWTIYYLKKDQSFRMIMRSSENKELI